MTNLADLDPREAADLLLAEHDRDWVDAFTDHLDRHLGADRLDRIMSLWRLSRTGLGEMFGVSRQAIAKWIAQGVPAERLPQVADVDAVTDLLVRYLERDHIPAVVRRRASGLDGMSLIELVEAGRSADALVLTRAMFTFADAHQ